MPPPMRAVEISFQSNEMAVRAALEELKDALGPLNLPPDEIGSVELVMAEALNNIVEHAYPESSPSGPIRIQCNHDDKGLHVTIVDWGKGMPGAQLPDGSPADLDVEFEDLPEGGFGWFLIRDIADAVDYARVDPENRLQLRFAVGLSNSPQ